MIILLKTVLLFVILSIFQLTAIETRPTKISTVKIQNARGTSAEIHDFLYLHDTDLKPREYVVGSVKIQAADQTVSDTGTGTLGGNGTGKFDYVSGQFYVKFAKIPPKGTPVTLTFAYYRTPSTNTTPPTTPPTSPPPTTPPSGNTTDDFVPASGRDRLPANAQGKFPIMLPQYKGVNQLLLLSNQWVIIGIDQTADLTAEIQKLMDADPAFQGINLAAAQAKWLSTSLASQKPDYGSMKTNILAPVNRYYVTAREKTNERKMADPAFFSITSTDDPDYSQGQVPVQLTHFVTSLGRADWAGNSGPYSTFAAYAYLQFPFPMKDGKTYTVTTDDGKSVTFTYDEYRAISRSIKTNQIGYLPSGKKYAYLGGYLWDLGPMDFSQAKTFHVIDVNSGAEALSGTIVAKGASAQSGENLYEMDLSGLTTTGEYFISIPGVGRSWSFHVGKNAYGEAFYTMIRGLYMQRSGMAVGPPYTNWPRKAYHNVPVYENDIVELIPRTLRKSVEPYTVPEVWSEIADFDVSGASIDMSKVHQDGTGGWYDAGDYQKRLFHFNNLFALLYLYELKSPNLPDNQLNIPESGDGIPDVLNEAEWGLKVWRNSMDESGGVSTRLLSRSHPAPDDPDYPYSYGKRTRYASLTFAAAAAQFARLVKPFSASKAREWQALAEKAYAFGTNPANKLVNHVMHAKTNRGTGTPYTMTYTEDEAFNAPFLSGAKMQMYLLTQDKSYLDGLTTLLAQMQSPTNQVPNKVSAGNLGKQATVLLPATWPFTNRDYLHWLMAPLIVNAEVQTALGAAVTDTWAKTFIGVADGYLKFYTTHPYRIAWDPAKNTGLAWGAATMTNQAVLLLLAHHITKDPKYLDAAVANADYMLGANPMGMSWGTGLGFVYPIKNHYRFNDYNTWLDPVPGMIVYGPNELTLKDFDSIWYPKDSSGTVHNFLNAKSLGSDGKVSIPVLRRWVPHNYYSVGQNEFTIWETNAGAIFTYGYLLDEAWTPSAELKNRKPRDERLLFGLWYLP